MDVVSERELVRLRILGLLYGVGVSAVILAFCAVAVPVPWWQRCLLVLLGLAVAAAALGVALSRRARGFVPLAAHRLTTVFTRLQDAVGSEVDLSLRNNRLSRGRFKVEALEGNWVKLTSPSSEGAIEGGDRGPGWMPISDIQRVGT